MKKTAICMLFAMLTMMSLVLPIAAEEVYDSIQIPSQEVALVCDKGEETVKLYCGSFMKAFSEKNQIEDLLSAPHILGEMYMVYSGLDIYYKRFYEDKLVTITQTAYLKGWDEFAKYAQSPEKVFGWSVKVHNVYCLNGNSSHDGVYIYYVTEKGDYVLYKEYLTSDKEYFFPIADFYEFAAVVQADRWENRYLDGGRTPVEELYDLHEYEFKRPNMIWYILGSVALVIAGGVVTCVMIKRRRRRLETEEPNTMP